MHSLSVYEIYLLEQNKKYCYWWGYSRTELEAKGIPSWLIHENETYYWIFNLSRRMGEVLDYSTVPSQLQFRIGTIETIRFRKYANISPVLKNAVENIVRILKTLNNDLLDASMWRRKNLLSYRGYSRWEKACIEIEVYRFIKPDVEWREAWIKEYL